MTGESAKAGFVHGAAAVALLPYAAVLKAAPKAALAAVVLAAVGPGVAKPKRASRRDAAVGWAAAPCPRGGTGDGTPIGFNSGYAGQSSKASASLSAATGFDGDIKKLKMPDQFTDKAFKNKGPCTPACAASNALAKQAMRRPM
ncbi:secondary active sulfate transmembrane transporter [Aureococcus anophagefferens]|nr:secondary active sulfate transmembrane transporter [Aureococcus anophagefferens]